MEAFKLFLKFATLGVTVEVFYTAIYEVIVSIKNKQKVNMNLKGVSYIWMIPIYGSIAFFSKILIPWLIDFNLILRMFIYGVIILVVEYILGFILKKITGKCPWEYNSRWSIHGFIRLDYLPLWMLFGLLVEKYYFF